MSERSFFLGWQERNSRAWYPIGRLDAEPEKNRYAFAYTHGAEDAVAEHNFEPLYDFPELGKRYQSDVLFPLFKNRVMTPGRRSFQEYLHLLDLAGAPDPLDILAIDGGYRATDSYQVFPKIESGENRSFRSRFFLHGWSHTNPKAQERLMRLERGEELFVTLELTNPKTGTAVQIQSEDYFMLGWAPRYLVGDLVKAMAQSPENLRAKIIRIYPVPAPSKQRVLIELSGNWPLNYKPMESREFQIVSSHREQSEKVLMSIR